MKIIPFCSLPEEARRLIVYYAIGEPEVVGFVIFNAYLFLLGYSPLYVGSIISGASLITALILPLLGHLTDKKINAKYYLMLEEGLIGLSFLLYGFAQNDAWIFAGRVIFSTAMMFSFASNVYEKELYPEEQLEDAYVWHWIIPSVAGIVAYMGAFIYFSIFLSIQAARFYYIVFGALAPVYIAYIYLALPNMPTYRKREKIRFRRELLGAITVVALSYLTLYFLYGIAMDNIIINHFNSGIAVIVLLSIIDSVFGFSSSMLKANLSRRYFAIAPYLAMAFIGLVSLAIFLVHILGAESLPLFIIFYSIIAFLWPLWHMSFKPILLRNVPKKYRGTIFSGVSSLTRILNIPMAFIVGVVITLFGSFAPLLISSSFAFATMVVLRRFT